MAIGCCARPACKDALIVALDKKTGKTIWKAQAPADLGSNGTDGAGYSSIVISNGGGVKQYVQIVGRGVVSVRRRRRQVPLELQPRRQCDGEHSHAPRQRRLCLCLHRLPGGGRTSAVVEDG